ncbi:MAG: glycerol-3-phosphate 1-O-acyltransferase PlsY [Candidatus Omnitrophota bacterium]
MPWIISAIIISYLIGSIPTAYIFGRLMKGIDIRQFGSGNIGATNALRVLGKKAGVAVLLLDAFKGFIVVVFLGNIVAGRTGIISAEALRILLGTGCIIGHSLTVFLKFKGGKGVATAAGVMLALSYYSLSLKMIWGLAMLSWVAVFMASRIVSLASLVTAIALPIYLVLFKQSKLLVFFSVLLAIFVIFRHKSNLIRLLKKQEPRLNINKSKNSST